MFSLVRDKQTGQWYNPDQEFEKLVSIPKRHGSAYDRGGADAYYRRRFDPHFYTGDTYNSKRVTIIDPESAEWKAYEAGFRDTKESGDHKDWG